MDIIGFFADIVSVLWQIVSYLGLLITNLVAIALITLWNFFVWLVSWLFTFLPDKTPIVEFMRSHVTGTLIEILVWFVRVVDSVVPLSPIFTLVIFRMLARSVGTFINLLIWVYRLIPFNG